MRNVSDKSCREIQNTYFMFNNFFFRKSCHLWDKVEKYCKTAQTTDDNVARACSMIDTNNCKYTLSIWNAYCFSTATIVTRRHIIVKIYVNFLSCLRFIPFLFARYSNSTFEVATVHPLIFLNLMPNLWTDITSMEGWMYSCETFKTYTLDWISGQPHAAATSPQKKVYSFCIMVEASDHGYILHTRRIHVTRYRIRYDMI
jgi:hypothetical protein